MNDADLIDDRALEMEPEPEEHQNGRRGWAGWLISVAFHSLLIAVMSCVYFLVKKEEIDTPPTHTVEIPPPKQVEEKVKDRTFDEKIDLKILVDSDVVNPLTQLELPVEKTEREEESDQPETKGREEAIADSEMGSTGAFMAIGTSGNASGMYGKRTEGGRKRTIGTSGSSVGSEKSVDGALRWLKKHQSPNGMWDCVGYTANCSDDQKCEPGVKREGDPNVAMTGYALLCFLGAGYDHLSLNHYKMTVKKGLDYLISVQKADGALGERNYENAVGTMALVEAFAMTGDPALKTPSQNAVNIILARQNTDLGTKGGDSGYGNGFGWDYLAPNARNDSSVSGWNIMALKSAYAGQLDVGHGLDGAKKWLEKTWKATNPDWAKLDPYTGESRFPYTLMSDTSAVGISPAPAAGAPSPDHQDLSCVGAVCAVFLGHHAGDTMLETLSNYIMNHETPAAYPCNTYKLYYNAMTMFQVGGKRWDKWNGQVRDVLVAAQRKGNGCFDGSWDSEGTKFPGCDTGRVLSTVYCCLTLEVYYRYDQIVGKKK